VAAYFSCGVRAVLFRIVPFSHYLCGSGFEEALFGAVILLQCLCGRLFELGCKSSAVYGSAF
jgi:hypothetical protein